MGSLVYKTFKLWGTWCDMKTNSEILDAKVEMPCMGPGADTARWWVSYLEDLVQAGKYDVVLQFLSYARQSGALPVITKAQEEYQRMKVQEKRRQSGLFKLDCAVGEPNLPPKRPGLAKAVVPAPMKMAPYFYKSKRIG